MTKMAITPIYGKTPFKRLLLCNQKPGQLPLDLVCCIRNGGPTRFAQMMNLG